ncbi:hypothetical protein CK203_110916 [Vitis vinifera]|uniref:Uncharacterized protein n=1 Tax=Vitis vinifera TaxID=29760 RepID=A0A438FEE6_VITVI|nr:hypothetical protein CK203_110916 [Vitis vinifera]
MRPSSPIGWRGISSNNTSDRRCRTTAMSVTCPLGNRPLGEASFWRRLGSRRRRCGVFLATPSFGVILASFAFGSVTAMPHGEAISITTYDAAVGVLWRSEHHCQRPLKDENALNFYDLFATVASSIVTNVNNIPVLNGTNFKKWKERVIIVLKCMDLDYALREDRPPDLTSASTAEQRKKSIPWRRRFTGVVPHAKDTALESKSLPSVGNSRKSYLEDTYQRLARGKLVHFHGWKSLALPSVGLAKTTELCILALGTFPGNLSSKELEAVERKDLLLAYQTFTEGTPPREQAPERSILGFRQQKSNGKYLPMSVASFGRLQEPFRRRKVVSAKFRRHPRGLRNYFARPGYLHQAAKLASTLRFLAPFSRHGSCIVRRRNTLLYKSAAKFSQQKADSATL